VGFSVSGSFAILVLASFIAFGMAYSAGANSFERVTDATDDSYERGLDQKNTAINVSEVTYQSGDLEVNVTNTGTTSLSINATDVIVNGTYRQSFQQFEVVGKPDSDLWLPGETLAISVNDSSLQSGDTVKIVTEYGVAAGGMVP